MGKKLWWRWWFYHYLSLAESDLWPRGRQSARLLCPWDSPGKNTGVDCHFLFQGILLNWGLNPGLLHFRQTLYQLNYTGSPLGKKNSCFTILSDSFATNIKGSFFLILLRYFYKSSGINAMPCKVKDFAFRHSKK